MINEVLLEMLVNTYPDKVVCYVSKSALPHLDTSKCKRCHILPVNSRKGKFSVLFRYLASAIHNVVLLATSGKDDILFYNYNNVFSLQLIDWISRIKQSKVIIVCHGELEFLSLPSPGHKLYKKLMSRLVKGYFNKKNRKSSDKLRFLLMSNLAVNNIKQYVSDELYSKIGAIDHPLLLDKEYNQSENLTHSDSCHLNVGTVGILNEHKGSRKYLQLLNQLAGQADKIKFHAIGHMQCNPEPFEKFGVIMPDETNEALSDHEFSQRVSNLDFILYFYDKETYRLTASGALLDSIRFRKPIISLRNEYFEYFFEKYGPVGYLVNSLDEMSKLLTNAENLTRNFDFDKIAEQLKPSSFQTAFDNFLKNTPIPNS